jgi:hypothetical protein
MSTPETLTGPCPAKELRPYIGVSGPIGDNDDAVEFLRASELYVMGGVGNAEEAPEYDDM